MLFAFCFFVWCFLLFPSGLLPSDLFLVVGLLFSGFLLSAFCVLFLAASYLLIAHCFLILVSCFSLTALSFLVAAISDCCVLLIVFLLSAKYLPFMCHNDSSFSTAPYFASSFSSCYIFVICIILNSFRDCSPSSYVFIVLHPSLHVSMPCMGFILFVLFHRFL